MSRVGKKIIEIPGGVDVKLEGRTVIVKGSNAELSREIPANIDVILNGGTMSVKSDARGTSALLGSTRAQLNNMVIGVSKGFEKGIEIKGVGYKAQVNGNKITFSLGYSHPIEYILPEGISAKLEKATELLLRGADKSLLGQVAANIKSLRPPEPYKGSGIKYANETILRKEGKTGKK